MGNALDNCIDSDHYSVGHRVPNVTVTTALRPHLYLRHGFPSFLIYDHSVSLFYQTISDISLLYASSNTGHINIPLQLVCQTDQHDRRAGSPTRYLSMEPNEVLALIKWRPIDNGHFGANRALYPKLAKLTRHEGLSVERVREIEGHYRRNPANT